MTKNVTVLAGNIVIPPSINVAEKALLITHFILYSSTETVKAVIPRV